MSLPPKRPPSIRPGVVIEGYEILAHVADGGMGAVWLARAARSHDELVAIKTTLPELFSELRFRRMFLDEVRVGSRIHHPNVVKTFEAGSFEDCLYAVLEWIDGPSLERLSSRVETSGDPWPLGCALRIVIDLCAGLHAAHEVRDDAGGLLGVVHRDVSPRNILITTAGVTKLTDFGIAKARQRLVSETKQGLVRGTLAYMAPEQILAGPVDRRADIWGVGAVLHRLLTGDPPFVDPELLSDFASGVAPRPALSTVIPGSVARVLDVCLARAPSDRFATAADLGAALGESARALGISPTSSALAAFVLARGYSSRPPPPDESTSATAALLRDETRIPAAPRMPEELSPRMPGASGNRDATKRDAHPSSKHELLLELGRGGMGTVYLAVSRGPAGFSKLKVVKRLRADLARDEHFLKMFLDEARLTARLNHPNVAQTNEVGFDGAHHFLEMEYLEGQSFDALRRRAAKSGGLPLDLALYVLTQALAGLHYAHELKDREGEPLRIVHRDVSPHNIFVTYDGVVKVLDFGIAKTADSSTDTTTGVVKGKVTYMAPEQAVRGVVDRRADVFAVGVMLWEVLTGKRLWEGASDVEIFLMLQKGPPPSPRSVRADVPAVLDAICVKALAHTAESRFTTAREMQRAIEAQLATANERPGPEPLSELMSRLFESAREAVADEIAARLRDIENRGQEGARTSVDIPLLAAASGLASVSAGPVTGDRTSADVPSAKRAVTTDGELGTANHKAGDPNYATNERTRTNAIVSSDLPPAARRRLRLPAIAGSLAALIAIASAAVALRGRHPAASAVPPAASAAARCATNADCASRGAGALFCHRSVGACVPLETEDCRVLAEKGDVANDDTIWIGAMFPTTGPDADTYGWESVHTIDLAREDFMKMAGGLPSTTLGGRPRPLALLVCDDDKDPRRAAHHLVDDVGVSAVIGFHQSAELIDLATSVFIPKGTLVVTALNASPLISQIPQPPGSPRLVWRTTVNAGQYADVLAAMVSDVIEPRLRKRLGATPLKVAFVRSAVTSAQSIADKLFAKLRFNGKSAVENGNAFREFVYPDPEGDSKVGYAPTVDGLLEFRPHLVMYVSTYEVPENILKPLETRWSGGARPTYASTGFLAREDMVSLIPKGREERARFLGMATKAVTLENATFVMHYNATFTPKVTLTDTPASCYDALYVVAYAVAASAARPITGAELSRGIARLLGPGPRVPVGPNAIYDGFRLLRDDGTIDLDGALSHLDFDPQTGDVDADFVLLCPGVDERGAATTGVESGLVYSHAGRFEGTWQCP